MRNLLMQHNIIMRDICTCLAPTMVSYNTVALFINISCSAPTAVVMSKRSPFLPDSSAQCLLHNEERFANKSMHTKCHEAYRHTSSNKTPKRLLLFAALAP